MMVVGEMDAATAFCCSQTAPRDSQKPGEDFRRRNEQQRYRATARATKLDLQLKSYSKSSLNSN